MHPPRRYQGDDLVAVESAFMFEKCALEITFATTSRHVALDSKPCYSPLISVIHERYLRVL